MKPEQTQMFYDIASYDLWAAFRYQRAVTSPEYFARGHIQNPTVYTDKQLERIAA